MATTPRDNRCNQAAEYEASFLRIAGVKAAIDAYRHRLKVIEEVRRSSPAVEGEKKAGN